MRTSVHRISQGVFSLNYLTPAGETICLLETPRSAPLPVPDIGAVVHLKDVRRGDEIGRFVVIRQEHLWPDNEYTAVNVIVEAVEQ